MAAVAAVGWLSCGTAAWAEKTAPEGLTAVSVAQMRGFVETTGGVVDKVEDTDTGDVRIQATYPGKAPIDVDGYQCRGVGAEKRCRALTLTARFAMGSEAEAKAKEHALHMNWIADNQEGEQLVIWRYELIYGTSVTYLEEAFRVFLDCFWTAYDILFPGASEEDGKTRTG